MLVLKQRGRGALDQVVSLAVAIVELHDQAFQVDARGILGLLRVGRLISTLV